MKVDRLSEFLRCGTNERPSLQAYGNMYSRDYNIGLSNLVESLMELLSFVVYERAQLMLHLLSMYRINENLQNQEQLQDRTGKHSSNWFFSCEESISDKYFYYQTLVEYVANSRAFQRLSPSYAM